MSKSSQLRNKAQTFLKKGKVSEAIEAYKKLLQVESRNPNLYNELGDIYLRAEDRLQAVSSFEKAVDNYEKVALYNNAVAVCKKILRVVPNRLESIYKLGELKAKQKFTGEASNLFIQYFEIVSADEAGMRPELVLPKVEMVLELVPEDEELHARSAEVLTQLGLKISAAEVVARLQHPFVRHIFPQYAGGSLVDYRKQTPPLDRGRRDAHVHLVRAAVLRAAVPPQRARQADRAIPGHGVVAGTVQKMRPVVDFVGPGLDCPRPTVTPAR